MIDYIVNNIFGVIALILGIYGLLLASGAVKIDSKNAEKNGELLQKYRLTIIIGSLLLFLYAALDLSGVIS